MHMFIGTLTIGGCEINGHGEVNLRPEKTKAEMSHQTTIVFSLSLAMRQ